MRRNTRKYKDKNELQQAEKCPGKISFLQIYIRTNGFIAVYIYSVDTCPLLARSGHQCRHKLLFYNCECCAIQAQKQATERRQINGLVRPA